MRIIFEGNNDNKPIVFICERCQCIFEANNDEYEVITNQIEYTETKKCFKCKCPICEEWAYE